VNAWEQLGHLLRQFDFAALFDIALVATIIYYLLLLAKGTRAMQVLKGVAVLLAVMKLAQWAGLETLQWIIGQALFASAIVFVVLFQPELRAALDHLGRGYFNPLGITGLTLKRANETEARRITSEISTAVQNMASRRVGALIVIERGAGLDDISATGTRLGAKLSAELLEAIFFPGNPLHDGAAIVHGDLVMAAGCVLPLSSQESLPRAIGTRHRAALGLAENTDALVVVVSEETGNVSLAREGTMTSILQPRLLGEELTSLLARSQPASRLRPFARSAQAVGEAARRLPGNTGRAWGNVRAAIRKS
jgi:diadenylate cyclase